VKAGGRRYFCVPVSSVANTYRAIVQSFEVAVKAPRIEAPPAATSPAAFSAVSELQGTRGRAPRGGSVTGFTSASRSSPCTSAKMEHSGLLASPNGGANNVAKRSTLSGTVVANGNRVTLQNTEGPWTWLTLVRSKNTLYGVVVDPAFEGNVMLRLDRESARG